MRRRVVEAEEHMWRVEDAIATLEEAVAKHERRMRKLRKERDALKEKLRMYGELSGAAVDLLGRD